MTISSDKKSNLTVAIVVPVFNEAGVLEQTHKKICSVIDELAYKFMIYYINDGSTDETAQSLVTLVRNDARVRVIELSRNFGHQAAITAGLANAQGEIVITMDGDGQHPPEIIPQMINLVLQGYDIVQTQRMNEDRRISFKKWTSDTFYRLINRISGTRMEPGTADFRALSRQVVNALNSMPEYHRFLRGMVAWMGYPCIILPYHPSERFGGQSKYSPHKMVKLALDAIFSFSLVPLYIGVSMGGLMLLLAFLEMLYVLSFWVSGRQALLAPGWSSLMFIVLIVGGMLMVLLGFIGIYIGYIFQEVKRRPVYLIKKIYPEQEQGK